MSLREASSVSREGLRIRPAVAADTEALGSLIRRSVLGLAGVDYSPEQLASALRHLFGVDTRLIEDGTYYVVESGDRPVACGGWSRRRTLFGGDQYSHRPDDRLDPKTEAARIRAFFVHPDWARRGVARSLLRECERAARAEGFRRLELMATLTGLPFYEREGFAVLERQDLELPDGVRFPLARMSRDLESPVLAPQSPSSERFVEERLRDADDFFAGRGPIHTTLRRLADRLDREGIPYALIGAMALNLLGYVRQTVDLDVLLTGEGLERFRREFVGRGYAPAFPGATNSFRDSDTGIRIDVISAGDYPGDGKPKPVSFPDPARSAVAIGGYRVVPLEKLIELKLASGLSAPHRLLIDLADVQRSIEELALPLELADKLDPSVQPEYRRLWSLAQRRAEGPHERG
jgi:GNAT superfamily N-acetyltransferase